MQKTWKVIIPGSIGNIVDWYDFSIYGFFSLTIAKVFFPHIALSTGLTYTLLVFLIGYLARPIGGLIFGYVGDHIGRRKALLISISLVAIASFLLGCIPSTNTIGVAAIYLLLLARLIQGIATGGEPTGAFTFVLEHIKSRHGFFGAFIWSTVFIGFLFGSLASLIMHAVSTHHFLYTWGWRIPFWFAGLISLIILLIRTKMTETDVFIKFKPNRSQFPLWDIIKKYKRILVEIFFMNAVAGAVFYFTFVYMPIFFSLKTHLSLTWLMVFNIIAILISVVLMPIFGVLADNIGLKKLAISAAVLIIILIYPLLLWTSYASLVGYIISLIILAILTSLYESVLPAIMVNISEPRVRYTLTAFAYNTALAIFGGISPLLANISYTYLHSITYFSFYIIILGLFAVIALAFARIVRCHH